MRSRTPSRAPATRAAERQVLGRNWVRYQTMAAASLQAARMVLQAKSSTTVDRVLEGDRVVLGGSCVTVMEGVMRI